MRKILFVLALMFAASLTFAQTVKGIVIDDDTDEAVIGASVLVKGTTLGTQTGIDGDFTLGIDGVDNPVLVISYIGYGTKEIAVPAGSMADLGTIRLGVDALGLEEVVVTGVIDLVKDRETPVAVSTIQAREIQLKLGNQEFPEIMKTTPSVYATKQGGGYGDSRINVRGFNQRNVSVIINGQPVNDMENGWVYWSNWAGLQSIASGVEIQRGIGASKLAVPSVGGTINVVTRAADREQGGFAKLAFGNDGYLNTTVSYSTGQSDNGWSGSVLLGRWQGNGWVDGTKGAGFNYLAAVGYQPSENHKFNLTYTGAGQWHHQRSARISIRDFQKFGPKDDFRKLNLDWGMKDGKEYTFRRNFYNKPIATLNYDWNISDNTTWATALYGSWGRGGGTGPRGRNFGIYPYRKDLTAAIGGLDYRNTDGTINFDKVVSNNKSTSGYDGPLNRLYKGKKIGSNGFREDGVNRKIAIRRSSVNSHDWYGVISNLEHKINNWTLGLGVDGRTYKGFHYRVLNDLLGLDGYYSWGNRNSKGKIISVASKANPFADISSSDKLAYYNVGLVDWLGLNGLAEYNNEIFTGVIQAGISNQGYKRIDYFAQLPAVSDRHTQKGGFIKGGANYNINAQHNVFANAGYISKQPIFDAIFPRFGNTINDNVTNESIISFELGYGLRTRDLRANLNLYRTSWDDRFVSRGVRVGEVDGTATFEGLNQVHQGIELDLNYDLFDGFSLDGMLSLGDWGYKGDVAASVFDDNQQLVETATLYVDNIKVGDAAQLTASIGASYDILDDLSVDLGFNFVDNLYSDFTFRLDQREWANDLWLLSKNNDGALKLPSYGLLDAGLTYRLNFGNDQMIVFRANVNNVLDTEYISEASSSIRKSDEFPKVDAKSEYKGIDTRNLVWFGFGRTWNISAKYSF